MDIKTDLTEDAAADMIIATWEARETAKKINSLLNYKGMIQADELRIGGKNMINFTETIKAYAETMGFSEIDEMRITKPEFRDKVLSDPAYSLLLRKENDSHFFYILVDRELTPDQTFSLRICHRFLGDAPRGEYRMKISEFINFNDLLSKAFDRLYYDVLNYKEK